MTEEQVPQNEVVSDIHVCKTDPVECMLNQCPLGVFSINTYVVRLSAQVEQPWGTLGRCQAECSLRICIAHPEVAAHNKHIILDMGGIKVEMYREM